MNGKYEISAKRWEELTPDEKLWLIFDTFNSYRENSEKRFKRIEYALLFCIAGGSACVGGEQMISIISKLFGL